MNQVRSELVPRILSLCGVDQAGPRPGDGGSSGAEVRPGQASRRRSVGAENRRTTVGPAPRVDAVVVGISTGGPSALAQIAPRFPAGLPVPVLVVQHMPPVFTRLLAERLDRSSSAVIAEAAGGEAVLPGHWWIAPGDRHLTAELGTTGRAPHLVVSDGPRENSCRPSVDVLFRSAARVWGPHVLGVVMTGMGHDGLDGSEAIVEAGGRVIVQDEATSVVWGMPGSVARAGLADAVLGLDDLADEVVRRAVCGRAGATAAAGAGS
jgi:two-component system, chemotaxis family, protein-glutamate methylesterase/glutaminase